MTLSPTGNAVWGLKLASFIWASTWVPRPSVAVLPSLWPVLQEQCWCPRLLPQPWTSRCSVPGVTEASRQVTPSSHRKKTVESHWPRRHRGPRGDLASQGNCVARSMDTVSLAAVTLETLRAQERSRASGVHRPWAQKGWAASLQLRAPVFPGSRIPQRAGISDSPCL